jgi:uncharacterized membrane protein AbrB (regulator of aidB expression)
MREDFIILDPTVQVDFEPSKIMKLESHSILLIFCIIAAVCVAGYYAYQYYQLKDDKH